MNMEKYLSDFDRGILAYLNIDTLPVDYNPIIHALKNDMDFVAQNVNGKQFSALSRLAVLCQVNVFNHTNGPEHDGEAKSLRRHWYVYFKVEFAQPFSRQLDQDLQAKSWSSDWSKRLSDVCSELVETTDLTYSDLWISDNSRMMETGNSAIASGYNVILAVEKDSEFEDFRAVANKIGAALYSNKGKSSRAASEKLLRNAFDWSEDHDPFSDDNPLIVLVISDYDFDGESVIAPSLIEQFRIYTPFVIGKRVGINPDQVTEYGLNLSDVWYEVKSTNKAYREWQSEKGIHGKYGLEVEVLPMSAYYKYIVNSLVNLVDFDALVQKLHDKCKPDVFDAIDRATTRALLRDHRYQEWKEVLDEYEDSVRDLMLDKAYRLANEVEKPENDVSPDDFVKYVTSDENVGAWRPFSSYAMTNSLVDLLLERTEMAVEQLQNRLPGVVYVKNY